MPRQWLIVILVAIGIFVFSMNGLKGGPEISVSETVDLLKGAPAPVMIDVRDRAMFDQGHIAGARPVPIAQLKTQLSSLKLPKFEAVIVYDELDEGDSPARQGTKLLYDNGYFGGLTLKGGLKAWRSAGQAVQKPQPTTNKITVTAPDS